MDCSCCRSARDGGAGDHHKVFVGRECRRLGKGFVSEHGGRVIVDPFETARRVVVVGVRSSSSGVVVVVEVVIHCTLLVMRDWSRTV